MRKPPKPEPFTAAKEVKRRARIAVGAVPPGRAQEGRKGKPPKHRKRAEEAET